MSEAKTAPGGAQTALPPEPLTLDGAAILHQMVRVNWAAWKRLDPQIRRQACAQAETLLAQTASGSSALFSLLGHKGDLMLVHFRPDFAALQEAERQWQGLALADLCEYAGSYLSVVELGLYEASLKLYQALAREGIAPGSPPWSERVSAERARLRELMAGRLSPPIPQRRYLCFYPMDKRRGEQRNWYELPIARRQELMHDHGLIGRKYAGQVTQIISGSIGLDDWEWGVDLFADDPLVFKKLIYEMRFDSASAAYAAFGTFYLGLRIAPGELAHALLA
ncbi:MAG TPA: hydrogen peroxide-dependent heme synthase [Candidatus Binataceae bacterium]|nr:hydrogen peroxide-dependent heme synthase [Candidatus Binataceae bacterium]